MCHRCNVRKKVSSVVLRVPLFSDLKPAVFLPCVRSESRSRSRPTVYPSAPPSVPPLRPWSWSSPPALCASMGCLRGPEQLDPGCVWLRSAFWTAGPAAGRAAGRGRPPPTRRPRRPRRRSRTTGRRRRRSQRTRFREQSWRGPRCPPPRHASSRDPFSC